MKFFPVLVSLFAFACSFAQYAPVPTTVVDLTTDLNSGKKTPVKVGEFSISELVTVSEFKNYLLSVQMDSSKTFYEDQLPKLGKRSNELVTAILNDPKFADQPMPGVSWTVARNYCKWLSAKAKGVGRNLTFDIPKLEEMLAYAAIYGKSRQVLETWLMNAYDESMFLFFSDSGRGNFYDAKKEDPPSMKRKMIYGGSYHMNYLANTNPYSGAYEYQDSSSAFIGFRIVCKQPVSEGLATINEKIDNKSISVNVVKNHLSGVYTEKDQNGKLCVLGEFYDGARIGLWSVFDTTGKLIVQRNYGEKKKAEFLFPETENPYAELYNKYLSTDNIRNEKGYFPYHYVEERAVLCSFRSWRLLNPANEPELFKQVDFKRLCLEAMKKELKLYKYGKWGNFEYLVAKENYPEFMGKLENWDFSRVEIKEDFFFNADQMKSDVRQLGISFYENKTDSLPKYSVYFPNMRELMATIPVKIEGNSEIRNLDDYFFFHTYRGTVVKASTVFEREENQQDWKSNNWKYELIPFVAEHDLWLRYNR